MTVTDIVKKFELKVFSGKNGLKNDVEYAYVSDLLSDVLGNAEENSVWITLHYTALIRGECGRHICMRELLVIMQKLFEKVKYDTYRYSSCDK